MRSMILLSLSASLVACTTDDKPAPVGECPMVDSGDAGDLSALQAQRCNVSGSMGSKNWYRLSATLPDATTIVQLELWPYLGAFKGGIVRTGTFEITGDELAFGTCGVCLRAMVDKGLDTQREFFATGGSVEVTAVGPTEGVPFIATITNASFTEISTDRTLLSDGCMADVARVKVTGAVMPMGGMGGGGGGGGGAGAGGCKTTIGD
jgi:hypothetical protein